MRVLFLSLVFVLIPRPVYADYPPPAEVKAAFLKLLDRPRDKWKSKI